eukprot:776213_1
MGTSISSHSNNSKKELSTLLPNHDAHSNDNILNYVESKQNDENNEFSVCVTGASGFIASHCIKLLLAKGYNVHGTVTGSITSDKYQWLFRMCEEDVNKKYGKLLLFQANLLSPHSFDSAIKNCDYVFHIASPVRLNIFDYQENMYEPAVNGTLDILNSCLKATKLKRVIFTSSLYAMVGTPKIGKVYDETDWNDEFTLESNPYGYSKTIAEQSAWKWMKQHQAKISFDLISICPALVIGKELNIKAKLSAGNAFMYRFLRGRYGRLNAAYPLLDVRDMAAAHVFFIENSEAVMDGEGRYCIDGHRTLLSELRDHLELYCDRHCVDVPSYETWYKSCCKCDCFCCGCCCMPCIEWCCIPKYDVIGPMIINKGKHVVNDDKIKSLGFKVRKIEQTLEYTLDHFLKQQIVLQARHVHQKKRFILNRFICY